MPDQPFRSRLNQEKPEPEAKDAKPEREKKPESTYPHNESHTRVHGAMGHNADDTPMARAWARLHDRQKRLGPALDDAYTNEEENEEVQHFAYGYGVRSLDEKNVNKTVRFYDARGFIAEESGL